MSLTIPQIMSGMPGAFVAEKAAGVQAIVHFKFTGAEAGEWNATIRDGHCEVAQGIPHSKPTITVTADSGDFCKLVAGEVDAAGAFMSGKLGLAGNTDLALRLLPLFKMP